MLDRETFNSVTPHVKANDDNSIDLEFSKHNFLHNILFIFICSLFKFSFIYCKKSFANVCHILPKIVLQVYFADGLHTLIL